MLTIGSVFSGIGGLELGLEAAGLGPVLFQCEIDPFCLQVLAKHWPDATRYTDVRTLDATTPQVDILCGGFPCTDISNAGKREGIGGEQSGLWSEFARTIGLLRPRFVVVENVAALLVRGIDRVLGDLSTFGYDAEWSCLRASDVGAPHRRERVFIVAWRRMADADELRSRGGDQSSRSDEARYSCARSLPGQSTVLAHSYGGRQQELRVAEPGRLEGARGGELDGRRDDGRLDGAEAMADTTGPRRSLPGRIRHERRRRPESSGSDPAGNDVADPDDAGRGGEHCGSIAGETPHAASERSSELADAQRDAVRLEPERDQWEGRGVRTTECGDAELGDDRQDGRREAQSGLGRGAHEFPNRLDRWPAGHGEAQYPWEPPRTVTGRTPNRNARLRALGNAVVPACAEVVGRRLLALIAEDGR